MPQARIVIAFAKMASRGVVLVLVMLFLFSLPTTNSGGQSASDNPQIREETLWENSALPNLLLPLALVDLAQSSDGSAVLLVSDREDKKSLFIGANESGAGHLVPLPMLATVPASGLRLVAGAADQIWIGGTSNYREAPFGGRLSDAYLAKLDSNGKFEWEHTFEDPDGKEIHDLAALSGGDVVVVGKAHDKSWLARISADAHIIWERSIGLGCAATVAVVGDTILVTGFDANAEVMWRFNGAGDSINHQVIEKIIDEPPGPFLFIKVFADKSNDAIYVFSLWSETFNPQESLTAHPLKVIKLDSQGQIVWRSELSQAVLQGLKAADLGPDHRATFCIRPIIGLRGNGDPLVACPGRNLLLISQLESMTGELTQTVVQRSGSSPCQEYRSWPKVIVPRADKTIWLFGAGRCMWLDRTSLMQ